MKKYTFAADSMTVCGPNFPEGKTFPVKYEMQDKDDMKRGQEWPTIHVFVKMESGESVKIDIPGDDEWYMAALKAAGEADETAVCAAMEDLDKVNEIAEVPTVEPVEDVQEPNDAPTVEPVEDVQEPAAEFEEIAEAPTVEPVEDVQEPAADFEEIAEAPAVEPVEDVEQAAADFEEIAEAPTVEPVEDVEQAAEKRTIPEKTFIGTAITGRGYAIIFDKATERTRVILSDPTNRKARAAIKEAGFFYSPSAKSWNRKLTFRAYRAANVLAAQLDKIIAA